MKIMTNLPVKARVVRNVVVYLLERGVLGAASDIYRSLCISGMRLPPPYRPLHLGEACL